LDWDPAIPPQKGGGAPSPIIGPCLLWPNGWMDQDDTWRGDGPWSRPHCARWGTSSRPPKRGQSPPPILGPFLLLPNGWMNQDCTWHGGDGGEPWCRPHCTRWGPSSPPPKRDRAPQFSAHFYCRQTAGWIKMALGMEVCLGPGDFVFDGDPATPRTEGTPTTAQFLVHVHCGQTAG